MLKCTGALVHKTSYLMDQKQQKIGARVNLDMEERRVKGLTFYLSIEGLALILVFLFCLIWYFSTNTKKVSPEKEIDAAEMAINPVDIIMPVSAQERTAKNNEVIILASSDTEKRDKAYILRFQNVARAEMNKFGIPASVKIAQALIESDGGTSFLATSANNHFGIKCKQRNCKKGHCVNRADDSHKDFFLIHASAWESYRAHSNLIADPGWRYAHLIGKCGKDYKCWATGLREAGYATDKKYDQKLIHRIEKYKLHLLDEGITLK